MISGRHVFGCKTILSVITCYLNTLEGYSIRFLLFSQMVHWLAHSDNLKIIVQNHVWRRAILTIFKSYGLVLQNCLKLDQRLQIRKRNIL
jgi:hypothetical protein